MSEHIVRIGLSKCSADLYVSIQIHAKQQSIVLPDQKEKRRMALHLQIYRIFTQAPRGTLAIGASGAHS